MQQPCAAALVKARDSVSALVGCKPNELMFTSCGTESDNHAIEIGVAKGCGLPGASGLPVRAHLFAGSLAH